jgi:hypothetical protein
MQYVSFTPRPPILYSIPGCRCFPSSQGTAATACINTALAAAKRSSDLSIINSATNASQLNQALRRATKGPRPSTAAALAALQQISKLHAVQRLAAGNQQTEQQRQAELASRLLGQLAPGIRQMSVG